MGGEGSERVMVKDHSFPLFFVHLSFIEQGEHITQLISTVAMPSIQRGVSQIYCLVCSRIMVYDAKILLSSQKMALASTPTQAIISLTFQLCVHL